MKSLFITTIISLFILASCTKDETAPKDINQVQISEYNLRTLKSGQMSDTSEIGYKHNVLLDDFFKNADYNNMTDNQIFAYFGATSPQGIHLLYTQNHMYDSYSDLPTDIKDFFENNPNTYDYYVQLRTIALNGNLSLQQRIDNIEYLEANFDFTGMSTHVEETLLASSSIARYSLYYWAPKSMGGLGMYDSYNKSFDWAECGMADLWGVWGSALLAPTPWTALGGGAIASAIYAVRRI